MLTVRQIERYWNANDFPRLARELLAGRAESSARTLLHSAHRVPCAALALIRLDEFAQPFHPLAQKLVRCMLSAQDPDGGWGDAETTALVVRALSTSKGQGLSITRGLTFLSHLQKEDGQFPRIPIKRTEADAQTTALVLHHLAHVPNASVTVNLAKAKSTLDAQKKTLSATPSYPKHLIHGLDRNLLFESPATSQPTEPLTPAITPEKTSTAPAPRRDGRAVA